LLVLQKNLQLVYEYLEQAPNVAPIVNGRVAPMEFVNQPYIAGLALDVTNSWKTVDQNIEKLLSSNHNL
jgi:hypothetical protein